MNVSPTEIHRLLTDRLDDLVEAVTKGLEATENHTRASSVSLNIKISYDSDCAHQINVECQRKLKAPKSRSSDLTTWTDLDLLCTFRDDEAQGQQTLAGALTNMGATSVEFSGDGIKTTTIKL